MEQPPVKKTTPRPDGCASAASVVSVTFLCFALVLAMSSNAYATPMADVLCYVLGMFQGNLGKGLATIGMCVLGVGAILGKVSWGMALTVGVGISVMVSSTELVATLGLGWANCPP